MTIHSGQLRLGLTTTQDRIRGLAKEVKTIGFDPVSLPCIRIDAIPSGREHFEVATSGADVLVLTSAHTVSLLTSTRLASLPIIAVGPETARAAEIAGGVVKWIGSDGVDGLADEARHLLLGRSAVIAGASNTLHRSAAALEAAGASVVSVPLYTTIPIPPPSDQVDAVIFGSPTAVAGWVLSRKLSDLLIGAIGERTASALRGEGFEPDVLPEKPGFIGMIECLAARQPERTAP